MRKSLQELADIYYGKSPNGYRTESSSNVPIYGTSGQVGYAAKPLFDGPLVVLARKGTLDNPSYSPGPCWVIDTAFAAVPKSNVHPKWLFYVLDAFDLSSLNEATGVPSISRNYLYRIHIETPTFPEQIQIAHVLSSVDRAIAQTEALIAKQQRIKTGLMQDLLTRGIDKNGVVRSEETHAFKDSLLGRIPVEWDVVTVDEIASITTGDKDTQDADTSGEYPFFVRSQTVERINSYSFEGEAVLTAGDGVGTGKVFHYYNGRFDFHQRVYCISSFTEGMHGYFFFNYFRMYFMSRVAQFSAKGSVDSVRLHMIAKMLISKPELSEQILISRILQEAEETLSRHAASLEKLRSIKTGLMQDLLTGKVRVTNLLAHPISQEVLSL